ncbi:MAG: ATP-binding protein [Deltaproteobacteria bacterium]
MRAAPLPCPRGRRGLTAAGRKHARPVSKLQERLSRQVGRAVCDYNLIEDGDRVLLALSGGKDSLALLRILQWRRTFVPIRYEILPVHVDLAFGQGDGALDIEVLRRRVADAGLELIVRKRDIFGGKTREEIACFWCAWNRRKVLFETADELGCRKIALGHHKDDIVETVLMNLLFEGEISAMVPRQELFGGKVVLIRPFAYAEERLIERFAAALDLAVPSVPCPHGKVSQRAFAKRVIREASRVAPGVRTNIFRSLTRVKKEYLLHSA